jgi:hypothetical protein
MLPIAPPIATQKYASAASADAAIMATAAESAPQRDFTTDRDHTRKR